MLTQLLDARAASPADKELQLVVADALEESGLPNEARLLRECERVTVRGDGNLILHSQWSGSRSTSQSLHVLEAT
jgi:uncharacterized protein (TIGR02996 family)